MLSKKNVCLCHDNKMFFSLTLFYFNTPHLLPIRAVNLVLIIVNVMIIRCDVTVSAFFGKR